MTRLALRTIPLIAAVSLAGCGLACGEKAALDRAADDGLAALRRADYPGFLALSDPDMRRALPGPAFERLAKGVQGLGAPRGRAMKGIYFMASPVRGTRGNYELEFEKGRVKLELFLAGGKIRRFFLAGAAIEHSLAAVDAEAARPADP